MYSPDYTSMTLNSKDRKKNLKSKNQWHRKKWKTKTQKEENLVLPKEWVENAK